MHYLIDGYNLLFCMMPEEKTLQKSREDIIQCIKHHLHFPILATIVFDGGKSEFSSYSYLGSVDIVFTDKHQSADEYIIEKLQFQKKEKIIVVTTDKRLKNQCQSQGADVISSQDFFAWIQKKEKKRAEKQITEKIVAETKEEFERLLKIFEKKSDK